VERGWKRATEPLRIDPAQLLRNRLIHKQWALRYGSGPEEPL